MSRSLAFVPSFAVQFCYPANPSFHPPFNAYTQRVASGELPEAFDELVAMGDGRRQGRCALCGLTRNVTVYPVDDTGNGVGPTCHRQAVVKVHLDDAKAAYLARPCTATEQALERAVQAVVSAKDATHVRYGGKRERVTHDPTHERTDTAHELTASAAHDHKDLYVGDNAYDYEDGWLVDDKDEQSDEQSDGEEESYDSSDDSSSDDSSSDDDECDTSNVLMDADDRVLTRGRRAHTLAEGVRTRSSYARNAKKPRVCYTEVDSDECC